MVTHRVKHGAGTELVAPLNTGPPRIPVERCRTGRRSGVTEYLLLIGGPGIQQVRYVQGELDKGSIRVANRAGEARRGRLKHRQADAAIQILRKILRAPVVSESHPDRSLFVQDYDVEGIVGHSLQAMGVDDDTGHCGYAGADRTDTATRSCIDQIGVVHSGFTDVREVGLQSQAAPQPGQEVKESLISELDTFDVAAVLAIDRTLDLRGFGGAVIGERTAEILEVERVAELLVEPAYRERTGWPHVALI